MCFLCEVNTLMLLMCAGTSTQTKLNQIYTIIYIIYIFYSPFYFLNFNLNLKLKSTSFWVLNLFCLGVDQVLLGHQIKNARSCFFKGV